MTLTQEPLIQHKHQQFSIKMIFLITFMIVHFLLKIIIVVYYNKIIYVLLFLIIAII